jgi:hypothetical protein
MKSKILLSRTSRTSSERDVTIGRNGQPDDSQCQAAGAETSSGKRQRTNAGGGDDSRAGANASDNSSAPPSPGALHVICRQCNALISGDPETFKHPPVTVNYSETPCAKCLGQNSQNSVNFVEPSYGPEFQNVFLNEAAMRHFDLARRARACGLIGMAEHEEATGRRMQEEAKQLSQ